MSSFIINSSGLSLEAPEMALDGNWGMLHSYMTSPHPLEIEKSRIAISSKDSLSYNNDSEYIEKDNDEEEQEINNNIQLCTEVNKMFGESVLGYYQRVTTAYNDILKSRITKGFSNLKPSTNIYDVSRPMKSIAKASWKIKELPGRNPLTQWPESLQDLNERLMSLDVLASWSEPILDTDVNTSTPDADDIYVQAEEYIRKTIKQKQDMINRSNLEQLDSLDKTQARAISALIGLSVLSGDYQKILSTLLIIYEISENYPDADKMMSQIHSTMVHYVNKLKFLHKDTQSYHHLANGSIYGCISLPKEASADYQNDSSSSLTTDGTYLYLYWCSGRGGLFKIGTGEGNSLAGKVYLHTRSELNGEVAWVYLNNKIYARRVDEPIGVLNIINPDTFLIETNLSLHCDEKDLMNNAEAAKFNKYYPLLTDGQYLYIIIMKVCTRERIIKEQYKKELEELKEKASKEGNKKDATENQNAAQNTANTNAQNLIKGVEVNTGAITENVDSVYKASEILKEAKVWEFYLLEFDPDSENYHQDEKIFKDIPEVQELYHSFSCYFTYEDWFRALKMNSDDIQAAAAWLVEEGNIDCQNTLISRRKVLLAQSEVLNDKINNRNEHDIQVKDDSILFPYDIMDSPWTLNNGQLALNKYFRNELDTKVFSIKEEDVKIYSSEEDKEDIVEEDSKEPSSTTIKKFSAQKLVKKKPVGGLFGEDSDESDLDENIAQPNLRRDTEIVPPPENDPMSVFDNALKMFEKLTLKGSFLKSIKDVKLIDYSLDLAYDHNYGKFYGLVSSQNSKVILIAQDMTQMQDAVFTNKEDVETIGIPESSDNMTLKQLVQKSIEFFTHFERIRFDLPWRWRRWVTVFSSANDSIGNKDNKIAKRYEKVKESDLNIWRRKLGLEAQSSQKKGKDKQSKSRQTISSNPYTQYTSYSSDSSQYKDVPVRIEERKLQAFCISGDVKSLNSLFKMIKMSYKNIDKELLTKALKAFINKAANPGLSSAQILQKELANLSSQHGFNDDLIKVSNEYVLLTMLIQQLVYWIRTSDTLSASVTEGNPQLLNEVGDFLYESVQCDNDEIFAELEEFYRLLWVAMINGFELFYRSSESQFKYIKLLLQDSFKFRRLSSSTYKRDVTIHYHYYVDSINTRMSPIQLFFLWHFKYPQTFIFRCPLVCSEVKEYTLKLKPKEGYTVDHFKFMNLYNPKFLQKAPQFYSLISWGGVIDNSLFEIRKDYEKLRNEYKNQLTLEAINETISSVNVSQKDFWTPFSMFFLLDQKLDFTIDDDKAKKSLKTQSKSEKLNHQNADAKLDDENEINEDTSVELFLNLYQNRSIDEILIAELPQEDHHALEEHKTSKYKKKKHKGKHHKEVVSQKQTEEEKELQLKLENEKKAKRRTVLRDLHHEEQKKHNERSLVLWNEFTELIVKQRSQAKQYGGVDPTTADTETKEILYSLNSIRYIWKIFNKLVEDSLALKTIAFYNIAKNKEFLIKCIKFAEQCIDEFSNDDFTKFNPYEWKWMRCFYKYFQIVTTQSVPELNDLEFSKNILPIYMKVINSMAKFLGSPIDDSLNTNELEKAPIRNLNDYSVCNSPYTYLVGGIDYTNEKIFETPHPYPRGEVHIKETYYFPKAIAVQIRFDPLCTSDSSNWVLQISTNDHSFWFNDNFGTQFRCSGKPHQRNPIILMPGSKVSVEFKTTSQGQRRKTDMHGGDSFFDRYGYKIAINAIYSETSLHCSDTLLNINKKQKIYKTKSKEVISWISVLNSLVNAASIMSQTLVKGSEVKKNDNPVITLSLLKGGFSSDTLDPGSYNPLSEYIQNIKTKEGMAYDVCMFIKGRVPSFEIKLPPVLAAKFTPQMIEKWEYIQNLSMICLMYHSDTIEDIFDFTQDQDDPDFQKTEEKLKVVWHYTKGISKWMQSSLQGEKEAQIIVKESWKIAQKIKDERITQLQKQRDEAKEKELKSREEAAQKKELESIKESDQEQNLQEPSIVKKVSISSSAIKVATSKAVNKSKKANRSKLMNSIIVPKGKKKGGKNKKQDNSKPDEDDKDNKPKEDEKKPEIEENTKEPELFTINELGKLCNDIYDDVYLNIANKLTDPNICQIMWNRFYIKNDETNPKKTIRKLVKRILKEKVIKYINIKNPNEIKEITKFTCKNMDPPEMIVMSEVEDKLIFLLELNQSVNLTSQILESENSGNLLGRLKSQKEVNLIKTLDYKSTDQVSDSDLMLTRSKSAVVKPKTAFKGKMARIPSNNNIQASKFVATHTSSKNIKQKSEIEEPSTTFDSVLSFIRDIDVNFWRLPSFISNDSQSENQDDNKSETQKSEDIILAKQQMKAKILENTYATADNRIKGFDYYNELLHIITYTNQNRSFIAPLSWGVDGNPFLSIEASGVERLKKMNNRIKYTLKENFKLFVRDYTRLKATVEELIKFKNTTLRTSKKSSSSKSQNTKSTTTDELIVVSQIRSIIESLNDLILLLSNNPAKEAFILHVVFEFQNNEINFGTFIGNLINLMLDTKDSLILLYKSHNSDKLIMKTYTSAKLLLGKFIIKETTESQLSKDAHLLLQETMLQIVVNMLKSEILSNRVTATKYQRLVTLFSLIKDILSMSEDTTNVKAELKESWIDLVWKCITSKPNSSEDDHDETNYSNRVIKAACNVARLCIDQNNVIKPIEGEHSFLEMMLKKIGQCVTVSDHRAQKAIDNFVLVPKLEPKPKETVEKQEQDKEESSSDENSYFVFASINNNSQDWSFLVTAAYECDKLLNRAAKKKSKEDAKKAVGQEENKKEVEKVDKAESKSESAVASKAENNKYYQNLVKLIRYAMEVESSMKSRGTTKIAIKSDMTLAEAQKVWEIFYKSYEGEIKPLKITTETVNALKGQKLLNGIDVAQIYPKLWNKTDSTNFKAAAQPGQGPLIKLSRDQLQMTICKNVPGLTLKVDSTTKKIINQRKFWIDNNSRKSVRTGQSSASVIFHLKSLIREFLFVNNNQSSEINQDQIFKEMTTILTNTWKQIINEKLEDLTDEQTDLIFGALEVVAGLINIVQPGSEIKMNFNGKESTAVVVDGGYYSGKDHLSVIVDNEDAIIKITQEQAKEAKVYDHYDKIPWNPALLPDKKLINEAIVACFKKLKESDNEKLKLKPYSYSLILLLLQKIYLLSKTDHDNDEQQNIESFFDIITQYHLNVVDIPSEEWEIKLCESWRRIVNKLEPELNAHHTIASSNYSSSDHQKLTLDNNRPIINEYTLPSSGYDQLPRQKAKGNESMAAIRLLAYWEKTIIPKIIEFVKSTYKPWEMEFYFEQLRFPLRHGDQSKALEEALIMCEKKMPAGCVIPDDSYDWSAKMPEECIVGSWFLVRFPEIKENFGVDEMIVILKAIDLETKNGLVEYIDKGSIKYNMWIPLKCMYDPPIPLNIPSVWWTFESLKANYENSVMAANAYYANKIIIDYYSKNGKISRALSTPETNLQRIKNIITWIIFNDYSENPVTGVTNVYRNIEFDTQEVSFDSVINKSLTRKDLAGLVQICANNLRQVELIGDRYNNSSRKLIEDEIENAIQDDNSQIVEKLISWIKTEWENLSTSMQFNSKINIDICTEYSKFAGIENSSVITPEGQEVIECRDKSLLLPLHELFTDDIQKRINVGMIISFDRNEYFKCSTATAKFYSDERGANLIAEISSASEQGTLIRPLVFNYGKVWWMFDAGTSAILPKHMQSNVTSSLKWTVTLIPYEWTSTFWITGYLSNVLLKVKSQESVRLIDCLSEFFKHSGSPASINCYVFGLLNKLIQNYRSIKLNEDNGDEYISSEDHFTRLHVDKNMIQSMITEVDYLKTNLADLAGNQTLYSLYIQLQIELIVGTLLPTSKYEKIQSISELLQMPNWLQKIAMAAQVLANIESPKNQLNDNIEQEIFDGTLISKQWERIIIVSKLPQDFTRTQIEDKLREIVKKHRGHVSEIYIPCDPDFNSNKEELCQKFELQEAEASKHKDRIDILEKRIKDLIEKEAEKNKPKSKENQKKDDKVSEADLAEQSQPVIEDSKGPELPEEDEKQHEISKIEEDKQSPESIEPVNPDNLNEKLNIKEYNHQGAAIIVLEEFDLTILTEEDTAKEKSEDEKEDVKEEVIEIPPELNIYNWSACTLENPMSNETCVICGTPRPPDAGMKFGGNKDDGGSEVEQVDPMSLIDEKYNLAIENRLKGMTEEMKSIISKLEADDNELRSKRKAEIENLKAKYESIKFGAAKSSNTSIKASYPENEKLEDEIKNMEQMDLGNLFNDQVDYEEPVEEIKNQAPPEVEQKSVEDKQPIPDQNVETVQNADDQDVVNTEDTKEDDFINEEPKQQERREDLKIFFGHTFEDDYKSELFLGSYLKSKFVNDGSNLKEKLVQVITDIYGENQSEINEFKSTVENEPIKAWKILESNGYDLDLNLVCYKTKEEAKLRKISDEKFDKFTNIIVLEICKESILSPSFRCKDIVEKGNHYAVLRELRYLWSLIRYLNKQLYNSLNLIYCWDATSRGNQLKDTFSLPRLLSKFRVMIHSIKFDLKLTVLDKTSIDREKPPELVFERLKIAHFKNEKATDVMEVETLSTSTISDDKDDILDQESEENHSSLFYSSYEQMSNLDITLLRPRRPQGAEPHLSFSVVFRGEYVVGEGGPYRQFFADLSSEIQPQRVVVRDPNNANNQDQDTEVSIICPSPNNLEDVTDYKEYFVINPSCTTTKDLALYEYLGVLMGVCIRTNVHLTLDLASIWWKPLVGEDITLQDIKEVDIGFYNRLWYTIESNENELRDLHSCSRQEYPSHIPEIYENKNESMIQDITDKIGETLMQCKAIKAGISKIIPESLLNLMTVDELREAVWGKVKCDLELLKRNTEYGGSNPLDLETSDLVKWFWEVLEEISEEDRLKFIVFCWGQERLPANDEEFRYSKTRFMIKPTTNQNYGDGALPRANTCFFNFELPNYSSKEVLKERLLLAINTDNRSMNAEQQELMEHQGRNDVYDDDY